MHYDNQIKTREVDNEEDQWRHNNHYIITEKDRKPELLIDLQTLKDHPDENIKLQNEEEILSQYVIQLNRFKFMIFPLRGALKLCPGIIINLNKDGNTYQRTSAPPMDLMKPGVCVNKTDGRVTGIMFLGGNTDKMCHHYDIENDKWEQRGPLPIFHIVTQQIAMNHND